MTNLPQLETPRLRMRPFVPEDLDAYYAQIWSDDAVMRYLPSGKAVTRESAQDKMVFIISHWRERALGLFAVEGKNGGGLLGHCGLNWLPDHQVYEIAYAFGRAAWGRGFATESGAAVLQHAFEAAALDQVIGMAMPDNLASQHVMTKLGMQRQGTINAYNHVLPLFVLSRADYLAKKARD